VFFGSIGSFLNNLYGDMSVDGIVEFILHFGKKLLCLGSVFVVIHSGGVNIGYLLIKAAFAQAYFPDFGKEVFKIIFIKKSAVFHSLAVYNITPQGKVSENRCSPLSESGGPFCVDPVAHGDYGVKVVVFCPVIFSISGSYREILGN